MTIVYSIVATKNYDCIIRTNYAIDIKWGSTIRIVRWKQHFKYDKVIRIAQKKGATIGENIVIPLSLAKASDFSGMILPSCRKSN